LEVTHHGPIINKPCCFIELGSSEEQWKDKNAAKILAKTIIDLQNYKKQNWIPCLAVGGLHYMQSFNKIQLNSNYAIGHAIPKYCFPVINHMLNEAVVKTQENFNTVLLDWKGLGEYKQQTLDAIKRAGLKYERVQDILKGN